MNIFKVGLNKSTIVNPLLQGCIVVKDKNDGLNKKELVVYKVGNDGLSFCNTMTADIYYASS